MASSVSSERAFSSAGITITKRRNRLKADVVEALQILKACFRGGGIMYSAVVPSLESEEALEKELMDEETTMEEVETKAAAKEDTWDWLESDADFYE